MAVVRRQFENFINLIARTDVIALLQQQGYKIELAEIIRVYLKWYPEMIKDIGKIIKPIQTGQPGGLTLEQIQAQLAGLSPGGGPGQVGQRENLRTSATPTLTSMQEQIGGEAGAV